MIRERRIFGQEASMGIGAKDIFIYGTFKAILTVIAVAFDHFTERLQFRSQIGSPGMIFKTDNLSVKVVGF